jgi:hypothetical protein
MPVAGVDALTAHADDRAQRGREGGAAVAVGKRRIAASDLDSILWAAEGLLLASSPTDAEAVEARTTFDMLMDGLVAQRWQDVGPTTAELQLKRLVEAFAECAPVETVPASV